MNRPEKADNVRLHFYVGKQLSQRVENVGAMLGHAKARAAAFLLDNASRAEDEAIAAIDERLNNSKEKAANRASPARAASGQDEDIVLMYVRLDPEVAARIERLAKKRGLSLSKVCAWLLSRAAEDDQWIVGLVQTRLTEALAASTDGQRKGRRQQPTSKG
ncbi:MAG TPA: hypothetical protein VGN12_21070 [Pirellulales bacterium]